LTPTLNKFLQDGVSTDYLQNVFPTKTLTNFFSIATGMYAETHGVLGNTVFNKNLDCIKYGYELYHSANVTPIWVRISKLTSLDFCIAKVATVIFLHSQTLNEQTGDGRRSGSMMWGGGEFEFHNILPTYYQAYNLSMPWHERINRTLEWLLDDEKPANLLNVYFEQPDSAGHTYGIDAPEFNDELKRVDNIFKYFLQQLAVHNIDDKVDVIVLSDHGMVDIDRAHLINVTQRVASTGGKNCGTSPVLQVTTKPGESYIYCATIKKEKGQKIISPITYR
jgi:predicted AlkP superfamily pyrophosphatase or phosphodiesterase